MSYFSLIGRECEFIRKNTYQNRLLRKHSVHQAACHGVLSAATTKIDSNDGLTNSREEHQEQILVPDSPEK